MAETKNDKMRKLIDALNGDLSREYQAIITYIQYAASVTGPYRQELKQFFTNEIPDETMHAQFLADKIAALGGVPAVAAEAVEQETDAKKMLENVERAERTARDNYSRRAEEAKQAGELALGTRLEAMAEDEAGHLDETTKILHGWR